MVLNISFKWVRVVDLRGIEKEVGEGNSISKYKEVRIYVVWGIVSSDFV